VSALNSQQFPYTFNFTPSQEGEHHKVSAFHKDDRVGLMKWDPDTGEVKDLQVHPEHRLRGVARGMWDFAQRQTKPQTPGVDYADDVVAPKHSSERTDAGDAFAKAIGGKVPARTKSNVREMNWS